MGCVCCRTRSHASYGFEGEQLQQSAELLSIAGPAKGREVVKMLVQIVQLQWDSEADGDGLFWESLCDCLVNVTMTCIEEGTVYFEYELLSDNQQICPFSTYITIPGTEFWCTKPHFVEWRDIYSGDVFGLNFGSETDAIEFLSACSPPTLTPTTARKRTTAPPPYISTTPPSPIARYISSFDDTLSWSFSSQQPSNTSFNQHTSSVSIMLEPPVEFTMPQRQSVSEQVLGDLSPELKQTGAICNEHNHESGEDISKDVVESEEELKEQADGSEEDEEITLIDDEDPELFQPSSPLEFDRNLPDIMEEEEDGEAERNLEEEEEAELRALHESNEEPSELDIVQSRSQIGEASDISDPNANVFSTSLSVQQFDQFLSDLRMSQLLEITEEKSWRISRQPESFEKLPKIVESPSSRERFSARLSFLLPDEEHGGSSTVEMSEELVTALSMISSTSVEDGPPEFPSSPPPGKLLSPRQSFRTPVVGRSLKRSLSHKEKDFLKLLGSRLEKMEEEQEEEHNLEHTHSQPNTARASPLEVHPELKREGYDKAGSEASNAEELFHQPRSSIISLSQMSDSLLSPCRAPTSSTRKTGWLQVKGVLIRKQRRVAMKSKRRWKKHWAVLKGLCLQLYSGSPGTKDDISADQVQCEIDVEQSLAYPVHDHLRRDHIFCLSTRIGDTYYLEAGSQGEVEDWIKVIHLAAASVVTMTTDRQHVISVLRSNIDDLETKFEKEAQMRKMAELQLSTVSDYASKSEIGKQLAVFTENMELLSTELYRMRCYFSSMEGKELPNPQTLLGCMSKPTKAMLSKIGMFSIGSVHAVVSVRELGRSIDSRVSLHIGSNRSSSGSAFSPIKLSSRNWKFRSKKSSKKPGRKIFSTSAISEPLPQLSSTHFSHSALLEPNPLVSDFGATLEVHMPNGKVCTVPFQSDMVVRDLLAISCRKSGLDPDDHFIRIRREGDDGGFECETPSDEEFISALESAEFEAMQKFVRTVFLTQPSPRTPDGMGLSLHPVWTDSTTMSHVTVESVATGSPADRNGISEGDEIVLVNDVAVCQIPWSDFTAIMQELSVSLTLRTRQVEAHVGMHTANLILSDLIVQPGPPPPPSCNNGVLSEEQLEGLIVPGPSMEDLTRIGSVENLSGEPDPEFSRQLAIQQLLQGSMEVTRLVGAWGASDLAEHSEETAPALTPLQQAVRCTTELVETEQSHVKNLDRLADRYLGPLQHELFLSDPEEVERIHFNISNITSQQTSFLRKLEGCIKEVDDSDQESVKQMFLRVAEAFRSNVEMFRQYCFFCTAQYTWSVIFEANEDNPLMEQFLEARNPRKDPTLSIESLIIKSILRVLRYPLFLQAMRELTEPDSEERTQLSEVILMVDKVASFINEVKRVTEMYASVFDALLQDSGLAEFGVSVHISDLQYHCSCMWLNPAGNHKELARGWKKGEGPKTQCFAFPSAAVLICTDREHRKRMSKGAIRSQLKPEDISHSVLLPLAQCKVNDLPDSDGVANMWQIVHKSRRGGGPTKYLLRSSSVEEKGRMVHILRQSIQDQISLYGGISASLSPTHTTTFTGSLYSGHSSSPSLASQMTSLSRTDASSPTPSGSETTTML